MALRTGEDTLIWKRNLEIPLCGGTALEDALDPSPDRILNDVGVSDKRMEYGI
jgi:hypothetical protein